MMLVLRIDKPCDLWSSKEVKIFLTTDFEIVYIHLPVHFWLIDK